MSAPSISRRLKYHRRRHKRTQRDQAKAWGVPYATYRNWEQGANEPQGMARAAVLEKLQGKAER